MKQMAAGAFKVHCLAVMDEVQSKRESVLITKRGKPVAKLVPVEKNPDNILQSIFSSAARLRARGKQREKIVEPRR